MWLGRSEHGSRAAPTRAMGECGEGGGVESTADAAEDLNWEWEVSAKRVQRRDNKERRECASWVRLTQHMCQCGAKSGVQVQNKNLRGSKYIFSGGGKWIFFHFGVQVCGFASAMSILHQYHWSKHRLRFSWIKKNYKVDSSVEFFKPFPTNFMF